LSRYIIHAGLQLSAKEFCYLRIIIVITAIDYKIKSMLKTSHFKLKHWANLKPYTSLDI